MQQNEELNLLIDKAAVIVGSDYKLAQALGITRQTVSNWRHGHKPCSPAMRAIMASIAGLDAQAELTRATLESYEGSRVGDMLMRALGKPLRATGAAIASAGLSALVIFGSMVPSQVNAAIHDVYKLLRRKQGSACYRRYSEC